VYPRPTAGMIGQQKTLHTRMKAVSVLSQASHAVSTADGIAIVETVSRAQNLPHVILQRLKRSPTCRRNNWYRRVLQQVEMGDGGTFPSSFVLLFLYLCLAFGQCSLISVVEVIGQLVSTALVSNRPNCRPRQIAWIPSHRVSLCFKEVGLHRKLA
jgi:hypothetical protein